MADEALAPRIRTAVPLDVVTTACRVPKLVGVAWGLLLVNTLGFNGGSELIIPFPHATGQIVTMGALCAALAIALALNPRMRVRPNAYLVLLAVLAVIAAASLPTKLASV